MEPMDILLSENHLPNMLHFSNLPKLVDGNICRTPSSFSVIKKHGFLKFRVRLQSNPVAFNSLNDIQIYYPKHIPMKLWFLLFARFLFYHPPFRELENQIHRQPPSTRHWWRKTGGMMGWCGTTGSAKVAGIGTRWDYPTGILLGTLANFDTPWSHHSPQNWGHIDGPLISVGNKLQSQWSPKQDLETYMGSSWQSMVSVPKHTLGINPTQWCYFSDLILKGKSVGTTPIFCMDLWVWGTLGAYEIENHTGRAGQRLGALVFRQGGERAIWPWEYDFFCLGESNMARGNPG